MTKESAVRLRPPFAMQAYNRMAEAGLANQGATATAVAPQASFLGHRAPGTSYFRSHPTASADVKNEGANGNYKPLRGGKMPEQKNDVSSMAGSATQGPADTCGNPPSQGQTSSGQPKQNGLAEYEAEHGMPEQDGLEVNQKLPRSAWKKMPFVPPSKRQLVQEVERLKTQPRIQAKRHPTWARTEPVH